MFYIPKHQENKGNQVMPKLGEPVLIPFDHAQIPDLRKKQ